MFIDRSTASSVLDGTSVVSPATIVRAVTVAGATSVPGVAGVGAAPGCVKTVPTTTGNGRTMMGGRGVGGTGGVGGVGGGTTEAAAVKTSGGNFSSTTCRPAYEVGSGTL